MSEGMDLQPDFTSNDTKQRGQRSHAYYLACIVAHRTVKPKKLGEAWMANFTQVNVAAFLTCLP